MVPFVVEGIELQEPVADPAPRPTVRPAQPVRRRVLVRLTADGRATVHTDDPTVEVTVFTAPPRLTRR